MVIKKTKKCRKKIFEKFQKSFLNKIAFYVEVDEDYKVNFFGEELTLILIKVSLFILYN